MNLDPAFILNILSIVFFYAFLRRPKEEGNRMNKMDRMKTFTPLVFFVAESFGRRSRTRHPFVATSCQDSFP